MLKRIIKAFGRFKPDELKDYPIGVWRKIESDARNSIKGFKLADYASDAKIAGTLHSPLRPGVPPRVRLGSKASADRAAAAVARRSA